MPPRRPHTVVPPAVIMLIGMAIIVFGSLRAAQPLTGASGVITESTTAGGFKTSVWLTVHYTYFVAGRQYTGQETVRNTLASDAPYQVGRELPVFFVTSAPERSYAYARPMALPWVLGGTILVFVGGIIVFSVWNA